MALFRGFIAIDIERAPAITEFEEAIARTKADVKLVDPHNLHITLKFLGDTDENDIDAIETIMKNAVQGVTPFTIQLRGSGVFPNQNYLKVIWIGIVNGHAIETIAQQIDEGCHTLGFQKEKRGFSSHLTIGRVKTSRQKQQLLEVIKNYADVTFSTTTVHSIKLKKSELTPKGPIYTTLREITL